MVSNPEAGQGRAERAGDEGAGDQRGGAGLGGARPAEQRRHHHDEDDQDSVLGAQEERPLEKFRRDLLAPECGIDRLHRAAAREHRRRGIDPFGYRRTAIGCAFTPGKSAACSAT